MRKYFWLICALAQLLCADMALADDIDILGASTIVVKPNVMILFDTSGSMGTKDIPEVPYDRDSDYTRGGGYEKNAIYRWQQDDDGGRWVRMVHRDVLDQTCSGTGIDDELDGNGQAWGRINTNIPYDCDATYDEIDLRRGNYLNYENGAFAGRMRTRLDTAKSVVKQLIEDHPDVRFGLMRFSQGGGPQNSDTKGGVLSEHGDITKEPTVAQLKADIDGFSADSDSPLAEALAEAGLYFSGQASWYNDVRYTSPIDIKCRPNAIILMTDGDSTKDQDARLHQENAYIHNGTIGDYDGDGNDPGVYDHGGTDFLDDVAMFLYQNDLMPDMGTGDPNYEKQHIVTHTIGFKQTHRLLRDTAANGGGEYFTAGSTDALSRVFDKILSTIQSDRQIFATPKIPVSRANGVYAGDYLYMGMFKPSLNNGQWRGNLKKYKLNRFGELIDQNNRMATDSDGMILASAQSYWSSVVDGTQVDVGGAGAHLVNNESRKLCTYVGGAEKNLAANINEFSIFNKDNIALEELGVANDDERQAIINNLHGIGKEWVMADVLHSEPAVVPYDTNGDDEIDQNDDALVFIGTNGGVMHAFSDSTGEELWGFIPPGQLGRLKMYSDAHLPHAYAIDGPPEVIFSEVNGDSKKTLVFGERRGGSHYYALDITVLDSPTWKYCIGDDILGKNSEQLGQSWGRPQFVTIAAGPGSTVEVLLLSGGYDTHQDAEEPKGQDQKGRAVFSVMADSGELGPFKFDNNGENSDMTHSIVDLVGVDSNGDGIVNSIYAPDLGGNMFAFEDGDTDGVWKKSRLFHASKDTTRKIFYSPDVINIVGDPDPDDKTLDEKIGEMIFFGTGDRAHPKAIKCTNRFYAVKNYHWDTNFTTMSDAIDAQGNGDLHDATNNSILQGETLEDQRRAFNEIKRRMGWFIDLEAPGEKVVSTPVVYNQTVYFTTYVPPISSDAATDDDCDTAVETGEARIYGLHYKDGRAVHDDWSDEREFDPVTQEEIKSGGKADRFIKIGTSIPSAPVMAIRDGIAMLYVGLGGKLFVMAPEQAVEMNMYYWREVKN